MENRCLLVFSGQQSVISKECLVFVHCYRKGRDSEIVVVSIV